jgi:hypothetical protein
MFYSFFACWRNRWPLLTFIVGVLIVDLVATVALAVIADLLVTDRSMAALLIAPLSLALLAILQGGIFRMYTQIIEVAPEDQAAAV